MKLKKDFRIIMTIFLIIWLTSGYLVGNDITPSAVVIGLWVMLLGVSALNCKRWNSPEMLAAVFGIAWYLLSCFLSDEPFYRTGATAFSYLVVAVFVASTTLEDFKQGYVKVMSFLCAVSLVMFFAYMLIPGLSTFNVVHTPLGTPASNMYIYIGNYYGRNMGLFWEPGAFQAFIALALLFVVAERNLDFRKIVLFVGTIITTFSTTGYIAVALIFVLLLFRWQSIDKKTRRWIIWGGVPLLVLFLYMSMDSLFDTTGNSTFGKLITYNERGGFADDQAGGSVGIRVNAVVKPIEAFLENPIFGKGTVGLRDEIYQYTEGMNTCTFVNWFAMFGIVFGIFMLRGLRKFSRRVYPGRTFLVLIFLFIVTISENFATNAFFFMLALYGFKATLKKRVVRYRR